MEHRSRKDADVEDTIATPVDQQDDAERATRVGSCGGRAQALEESVRSRVGAQTEVWVFTNRHSSPDCR